MNESRPIEMHYQDPLDLVWLAATRAIGIQVIRDPEVFAAWDGAGVLRIGTPETLDADDSLAQMILHELCHALVAGPECMNQPDWGLDYDSPEHQIFEKATLRLQAALADLFGLRSFLAATTGFRNYYDRLPANPLAADTDPAVELARAGLERAGHEPWSTPIAQALAATREIARIVLPSAEPQSLWSVVADATSGEP